MLTPLPQPLGLPVPCVLVSLLASFLSFGYFLQLAGGWSHLRKVREARKASATAAPSVPEEAEGSKASAGDKQKAE